MQRRLLSILSGVSAGLWVIVAIVFVRGFFVHDHAERFYWDGAVLRHPTIWSSGGRTGFSWLRVEGGGPAWIQRKNAEAKDGAMDGWDLERRRLVPGECREWYKFSYERRSGKSADAGNTTNASATLSQSLTILRIPYWPALVALPVLPAVWLRRWWRGRRPAAGTCLAN